MYHRSIDLCWLYSSIVGETPLQGILFCYWNTCNIYEIGNSRCDRQGENNITNMPICRQNDFKWVLHSPPFYAKSHKGRTNVKKIFTNHVQQSSISMAQIIEQLCIVMVIMFNNHLLKWLKWLRDTRVSIDMMINYQGWNH